MGKRHRAKVTRQVVEIIDQDNGQRVDNINFILDIGNGKVEELMDRSQNYAFFCIYLHYISFALDLHFICISHSPQN